MELIRVNALVHVDKWSPWLSALLKTKLVKYEDGQRKVSTKELYVLDDNGPGGSFAAGFLDDVLRMAAAKGIEVKYVDVREFPEHAYDTDPDALEVQLRYKQDTALNAIMTHDKGIIQCCTGFGKSFCIKCLTVLYPNARFVICTEAAAVVTSLYDQLVAVHGKSEVGLIKSGTKDSEAQKRIQVSTTKSILRSQVRTCDILLFDEVHNVGDNQITGLLMNNVEHARMFGFTASLWRGDKSEALIRGLFGEVITEVTYQEAVAHKLVVPIRALMIPCKGREAQVKDSMMLDKKFNYVYNRTRNQLIANIARDIPAEEQTLIMVSTFEHAVRLHQLLPEYTVCHGGAGVKIKRNKPWTAEEAPNLVLAIHKKEGGVHRFLKVENALGIIVYVELKLLDNTPIHSEELDRDLREVPPEGVLCGFEGKSPCIRPGAAPEAFLYRMTDNVVSLSELFFNYTKSDGDPCGASKLVDRHIGDVDLTQYRMTPKLINQIRRDFEANKLKKLIATNVFSEGVDFVHLKYLIRADGEVSKISSTQIPGRLSRLMPGKDCAYLIDFVDHFSYWAYRRSVARFKDYKESGWVSGEIKEREIQDGTEDHE